MAAPHPACAAIQFDREPYDAAIPRPFGRHAAGEGFLRGLLAHADTDRFHFWNANGRPLDDLAALVERLGPPTRPVTWIEPADRTALTFPGAAHIPAPLLQREAWARKVVGATGYSITGVTHTIAETPMLAEIAGLLIGPVEPWDALVCTSLAVQKAVQTQLEAVADYLGARLGAQRTPPAQLATIPLGVQTADFAFDAGARARWREALDVPRDAPAALHFGRFSVATKMNPAPMGLALQEASQRLGRPVYWILFGGARAPEEEEQFREAAAAFCPDVILRFAGEAEPDAHGPIWSAGDVFVSFSDNVQESFGLTVPEAMAAGLPCVVSDWDGYRASVRHGTDGFLIRTVTPRPGLGADLAFRYHHGLTGYQAYYTAQSQFTAVDIEQAAGALAELFANPDLRARMGEAAAERARTTFDWRVVIPQYQALWSELERRRKAAPVQAPEAGGDNPWGLDPFRMFAAYPSHALSHRDTVQLRKALSPDALAQILAAPSVRGAEDRLPTPAQVATLVALLSHERPWTVGPLLDRFAPEERPILERGLVWLAKFGVLKFSGSPLS